MTKTFAIPSVLIPCLALAACGDADREARNAREIAAIRDNAGDRPRAEATPAPIATTTLPAQQPQIAPQIQGQVQSQIAQLPVDQTPALAVSTMGDRPVVQPSQGVAGVGGGEQAETIPSYPPRSGITTGRLCAAAVGRIMGRTELQVGIQYESPALARVGYQRADRTQWTYDCRFDGGFIVWRTVEDGRPGRWRTDPTDERITYVLTPGGATVTVDGEQVRIAA